MNIAVRLFDKEVPVKGSGVNPAGGFKTIHIGEKEYSADFIAALVAAYELTVAFKKIK